MADSENRIMIHDVSIDHLFVGAISQEGFYKNTTLADLSESLSDVLSSFFLKPFQLQNFFTFSHELDVAYNGAYASCQKIFKDSGSFLEESQQLLQLLYSVSDNENIKEGEFYSVLFNGLSLDESVGKAIGIFKSEERDPFLKVYQENDKLNLVEDEGISINNINKGALILESESPGTYKIVVFDRSNRANPARFWIDHFLNLKLVEDDFYHTKKFIHICKDFALKGQDEVDRADQVDLINRSMQFFEENEQFDRKAFDEEVLQEPEKKQAFKEFQSQYGSNDMEEQVQDNFDISAPAYKAMKRYIRSVIKLDKNFHLYVHGKRNMIERGFDDDRGKHYYKLFFDVEN